MKKLIFNRKAGTIPIAIIIVAILIVAGVAYYVYSGNANPYWETESEFGLWQEEIIIEYEDGSTQSLKLLMENENKLFATVTYNGQAITRMLYKVRATATGEGYTGVEIDINDLSSDTYFFSVATGDVLYTNVIYYSGIKSGNLGESFVITELILEIYNIANNNEVEDGIYGAGFRSRGVPSYRGTPDGEWKTDATLPSDRTVLVLCDGFGGGNGGGNILLELTSTIGAN